MAFKWYETTTASPVYDSNTESDGVIVIVHPSDLSDGPQDFEIHFADVEADPADSGLYKVEAYLDFDGVTTLTPGTSQIQVKPIDNAPGSGHEDTEVKLALTAAGLDSAVAGATLDVGTQILSGASNALVVHIRVTNAVTTVGNSTELRLKINGLMRQAV